MVIEKINNPVTNNTLLNKINEIIDYKQDILVSGTNIKTINNTSLLGSGNLEIDINMATDNVTINKNSSNELQAIAVINPKSLTAMPIWNGTEQQWNEGEIDEVYYNWKTSKLQSFQNGRMFPSGSYYDGSPWSVVGYNGSRFVALTSNTSERNTAYSTNGINWTSGGQMPLAYNNATSIAYGNGIWVGVCNKNRGFYSTNNGSSWVSININNTGYTSGAIAYGNGVFVTIERGSGKSAYAISSNPTSSWTQGDTNNTSTKNDICYGDKFVIVGDTILYSSNGTSWTQSNTDISFTAVAVTYGNGKYVAIGTNNVVYSEDGNIWNNGTIPNGEWSNIAYGNGVFIAISKTSNNVAYSEDGINWFSDTLPVSGNFPAITFGNDKFIIISNSGVLVYAEVNEGTNKLVYTTDYEPTTESIVYDEPNVVSALTITNVSTGTITLSDGDDYKYNADGNEYTYSTIGVTHPEYLCAIDGVGVKKGNTIIASIAPTVDQTYSASSTNAQSGVAIAEVLGDIESTINTIRGV